MKMTSLVAAIAVVISGCHHAPIPVRPATVFPATVLRFDNGVDAFICEDRAAPVVAMRARIEAGSQHDPLGRDGMALLVRELLTRSVAPGQKLGLAESLELLGVSQFDVSTNWEYTEVSFVSSAATAPTAIRLVTHALINPLSGIDAGALRDARHQRLVETKSHQTALAALRQQVLAPTHPLAHSESGTPQTLERIEINDLDSWVGTHFAPNRIDVSMVGALTVRELTALLAEGLSSQAQPGPAEPNLAPPPPPPSAPALLEPDLEADVEDRALLLGFSLPGLRENSTFDLPWAWRLVRRLQSVAGADAVISDAAAHLWQSADASVFGVELILRHDVTHQQATAFVREHWAEVAQLSSDEALWSSFHSGRETVDSGWAESPQALARRGLRALRPKTTVSSVVLLPQIFENYLPTARMRMVRVTPPHLVAAREPVPAGRHVVYPPDEIRKRTIAPRLDGSRQFTLENGLQVTLLDRPWTKGIHATAIFEGGYTDVETPGAAMMAYALGVAPAGSVDWNRDTRPWSDLQVAPTYTRFQFEIEPQQLSRGLEIIATSVARFSVSGDIYRRVARRGLNRLQTDALEARSTVHPAVLEALYNDERYLAPLRPGLFHDVSEDAANRWARRVLSPARGHLVLSGNFDPAVVEPAVRAIFAGLSGERAPLPLPRFDTPKNHLSISAEIGPDGAAPGFTFACRLPAMYRGRRYEASQLLAAALARRFNAAAGTRGNPRPLKSIIELQRGDAATLTVSGVTDPGAEQVRAVMNTLATLFTELWSDADIDAARWALARGSGNSWADAVTENETLARLAVVGIDAQRLAELPATYATLPTAAVDEAWEACREHLVLRLRASRADVEATMAALQGAPESR